MLKDGPASHPVTIAPARTCKAWTSVSANQNVHARSVEGVMPLPINAASFNTFITTKVRPRVLLTTS